MRRLILSLLLTTCLAPAAEIPAAADADATWAITLQGFFMDAKAPGASQRHINLYLHRTGGAWGGAVATATNRGKPTYNVALHLVDPSGLRREGDRVVGNVGLTIVPDPWVPADQKMRRFTVAIDAALSPSADGKSYGTIGGEWKATYQGDDTDAALAAASVGREWTGRLGGALGPNQAGPSDDITANLQLFSFIPGAVKDEFSRRRGLRIGLRDGKVTGCQLALVSQTHQSYDDVPQPIEGATLNVTTDAVSGTATVVTESVDGVELTMTVELSGSRLHDMVAGTWRATIRDETGAESLREGGFRGGINAGALATAPADPRPWWLPVPGFRKPEPGEHPRLFFRREDVPALRQRAATPEGQRIVARLKQLLGGGEAMPTSFNPAPKAYSRNRFKPVMGTYTISHAAGFGFLYQLTGEKRYADLAAECVRLALAGQRDRDDRYSFRSPGGQLRAGPSLGWTAVAYDLCYDAWEPAFRERVLAAIRDYDADAPPTGELVRPPGATTEVAPGDAEAGSAADDEEPVQVGNTLEVLVFQPRHGPGSNHFGSRLGGVGLAMLAIEGDPGTDPVRQGRIARSLERQVARALADGFGDGGYFTEGHGPGQIGADTAFVPYLQALRTAAGRDYVAARPNPSWVSMLRVIELVGPPARYLYRSNMGSSYGGPDFDRTGLSRGGQVVQGMGVIPPAWKPAMLWTYEQVLEPDPSKRDFDTVSLYPHRAMLALINWPLETPARNPAEVLPRVVHDSVHDYVICRNRWQDVDDTVVSLLARNPKGHKPAGVLVRSCNQVLKLGELPKADISDLRMGADGSMVVKVGDGVLAVDYSGAAGCPVVVAVRGGKLPSKLEPKPPLRWRTVADGEATWGVLTAAPEGEHPPLEVVADGLRIGGQRLVRAGDAVSFAVFTPAVPPKE